MADQGVAATNAATPCTGEPRHRGHAAPVVDQRHDRHRTATRRSKRPSPGRRPEATASRSRDESRPDREAADAQHRPVVERPVRRRACGKRSAKRTRGRDPGRTQRNSEQHGRGDRRRGPKSATGASACTRRLPHSKRARTARFPRLEATKKSARKSAREQARWRPSTRGEFCLFSTADHDVSRGFSSGSLPSCERLSTARDASLSRFNNRKTMPAPPSGVYLATGATPLAQ